MASARARFAPHRRGVCSSFLRSRPMYTCSRCLLGGDAQPQTPSTSRPDSWASSSAPWDVLRDLHGRIYSLRVIRSGKHGIENLRWPWVVFGERRGHFWVAGMRLARWNPVQAISAQPYLEAAQVVAQHPEIRWPGSGWIRRDQAPDRTSFGGGC